MVESIEDCAATFNLERHMGFTRQTSRVRLVQEKGFHPFFSNREWLTLSPRLGHVLVLGDSGMVSSLDQGGIRGAD